MADTLLQKFCRLIGLQASPSAHSATDPAVTVAALEARLLLQQRLMSDRQRQARQQTAMLGEDATANLQRLLSTDLSPPQTALLDQTMASVQAMQFNLRDTSGAGFSLRTLLDQVCLLAASQASRHGSELHPLVYDDLPSRFHGDPEPLRALLVLLCSHALRSMESGALIIRAMLDDSEADPIENQREDPCEDQGLAPDPHKARHGALRGGPRERRSRVCFSLQRECGAVTVPWGEYPSDCRGLAASLHARLPPASDDEQLLCAPLMADDNYRAPPLPNPLDARVVALFHPCAAARASLNYRLRGMNLHSRPVEHLGEIDTERSVALLLALPAGHAHDHTLAVAASLALPELIVLSDAPRPTELAATVQWLPASIDDERLYQHLQQALRRAETTSPPTPIADAPELARSEALRQAFLANFPQTLSELRACLQRNDRSALKTITHKLKGGAAYCDLPALYRVARRLDQAACCAPASVIDYLLQRLAMEAESADDSSRPAAK